jgi:glycosyltransferase involved in cell wall biosynthesis
MLPIYFKNVIPIADEIILMNDNSSDKSLEVIDKFSKDNSGTKITVYHQEERDVTEPGWPEGNIREKLFDIGRDHGATHFLNLDADETFSTNFLQNGREKIEQLSPGQIMWFPWVHLFWSRNLVSDNQNYGAFVQGVDDKKYDSSNDGSGMHTTRCSSLSEKVNPIYIPSNEGCMLHYQYLSVTSFAIKQIWYMCSEILLRGSEYANQINSKYGTSLSNLSFTKNKGELLPIDEKFIEGIELPDYPFVDLTWSRENLFKPKLYDITMGWFKKYGVEKFENLSIWFVPKYLSEFISQTGRKPGEK